MKVKCVRYVNDAGEAASTSPWLIIGMIYDVLGIVQSHGRDLRYLIVTNDKEDPLLYLGFFLDKAFDVVDDTIPDSWLKDSDEKRVAYLPKSWLAENFFENLFDRDPDAYRDFEEERQSIITRNYSI